MKKLYRNTNDKMIAGVCSGLSDYLNIDVTVIRILWVCAVVFGGIGIIPYIACALIMPEE